MASKRKVLKETKWYTWSSAQEFSLLLLGKAREEWDVTGVVEGPSYQDKNLKRR